MYELITKYCENNNMSAEEVEEFIVRSALKQIPLQRSSGWYGNKTECPKCHIVESGNYCRNCGQKLI